MYLGLPEAKKSFHPNLLGEKWYGSDLSLGKLQKEADTVHKTRKKCFLFL